jgi:hypothetical protein
MLDLVKYTIHVYPFLPSIGRLLDNYWQGNEQSVNAQTHIHSGHMFRKLNRHHLA